jgi:hypothetical protein
VIISKENVSKSLKENEVTVKAKDSRGDLLRMSASNPYSNVYW